jgi:hypothetical protein
MTYFPQCLTALKQIVTPLRLIGTNEADELRLDYYWLGEGRDATRKGCDLQNARLRSANRRRRGPQQAEQVGLRQRMSFGEHVLQMGPHGGLADTEHVGRLPGAQALAPKPWASASRTRNSLPVSL